MLFTIAKEKWFLAIFLATFLSFFLLDVNLSENFLF